MYILIEEYNDWMDYITTTSYKIIKGSNDKAELEQYMKDNYEDMTGQESEIIYYIQEVQVL